MTASTLLQLHHTRGNHSPKVDCLKPELNHFNKEFEA